MYVNLYKMCEQYQPKYMFNDKHSVNAIIQELTQINSYTYKDGAVASRGYYTLRS